MISTENLGKYSVALPLTADEIVEFHAARLLLLIEICGNQSGQIEGLTKLAKLDFFVRYPDFFERVCEHLGNIARKSTRGVESEMVRHHYGPWDKRYYQVLSYLESKKLIQINKPSARKYTFELTQDGKSLAEKLSNFDEYNPLVEQMTQVKAIFGKMSGNKLKELIYKVFDEEVTQRARGEMIK